MQRRLERSRKLMGDLPGLEEGLDAHVDRLRGSYNWAVEKPKQPDAQVGVTPRPTQMRIVRLGFRVEIAHARRL